MHVLTAIYNDPVRGIKPYKAMAENMARSARRFGYSVEIVNLHDSPVVHASKDYYKLDCSFKPFVIRDALLRLPAGAPMIWLDSDCLVNQPFDEAIESVDAFATMRPLDARTRTPNPMYDGYINAGVIGFRNNGHAHFLIDSWISELENGRSDQDALARVLHTATRFEKEGEVVTISGAKVRLVPTRIYNFYHFPENWRSAKVLHIKGIWNRNAYEAIAGEVLGSQLVAAEGDAWN